MSGKLSRLAKTESFKSYADRGMSVAISRPQSQHPPSRADSRGLAGQCAVECRRDTCVGREATACQHTCVDTADTAAQTV